MEQYKQEKEFIENKLNKTKIDSYFKNSAMIIFIVFVFIFGLVIGQKEKIFNKNNAKTILDEKLTNEASKANLNIDKFEKLLSIIKSKYIRPGDIKENKFYEGALKGAVESIGDPYTSYFDESTTKSFNEEMTGSFSGIGAEVAIKDLMLTVVSPLPETPAEKAGIKAGDIILKINDEDTTGMPVDVAVSKIRGEKGTDVNLNILNKETKKTKDIKITRDNIVIESVSYKKIDNIGIIKISSFNDTTDGKFAEFADKIKKDKTIKGLVVDLRNNPGGYLNSSVNIASYWVKLGDVIVKEKDKDNKGKTHNSSGNNFLSKYKTIVLINEGSASASEILSGALKDHGLATLIGKKSFGKGSVQEYQEFLDGTALKVTVAEWFTPNDVNINKSGITPDIEVEYTVEDFNKNIDTQLNKAIESINKK